VPVHKWLICPISASGKNFNPQNTPCIPLVKILSFLELEQIIPFLDGHYLRNEYAYPVRSSESGKLYLIKRRVHSMHHFKAGQIPGGA